MSAFVALEGGEGVGKTTQVKLIQERFPTLYPNQQFVFTREPGGTPFANNIRSLILSEGGKEADGETMFGLFMAARHDHMRRVISPSIAEGKSVICDRFTGSSFAYQLYAQENPISLRTFDAHYDSLPHLPRLTIVLDMDPRVAQARIKTREGQQTTHFDTRPLSFHDRLREGYQTYLHRYSTHRNKIVLVNADDSVEKVHETIVLLCDPWFV